MTIERALAMTERELQDVIVDTARVFRWRVHHCRPAMNRRGQWRTHIQGDPGFCDLTLVRGHRLVFIECKREHGKLAPEQEAWRDALRSVPGVEYVVARPSTLDVVLRCLETGGGPC